MEVFRVLAGADVVGLEVPMGDAFVFQVFEEIEKIGNKQALHHARLALKHLLPTDDEPPNQCA